MPRLFSWLLLLLIPCYMIVTQASSAPSVKQLPAEAPKLLVLVVFDQMRGDYLQRWSKLFGSDGFNKLTSEGLWFTNCHYPYSMTVTGAGHATLGTGCVPAQHGIIENDWYDRAEGKMVYCATLGSRYQMVPAGSKSKSGASEGGAPARLLVPALGDVVKEATGSKGKVIGVSMKDRGGVLPTGKKGDLCIWYDNNAGAFVTSDYYAGKLPDYIVNFNKLRPADQLYDKDWTRLRADIKYEDYSGPDDCVGEGTGYKQGRTFPHPMTGGLKSPGPAFYDAVYASPMGNDLTWQAAKLILDNEKLGRNQSTDYLVISYSCNDSVGHVWGPDSQEVLDVTLRSDRIMAEMIKYLDEKIGREHYLMAVSADHGICPLPEVARSKGQSAGRVDATKEVLALELHLNAKYRTTSRWIEGISGAGVYLNQRSIKASGHAYEEVEAEVAAWFMTRPYVQEVCTRSQMFASTDLSIGAIMNKNCFHPDRSGDIMPLLKPYWFISKYTTGTTHGSPNEYDTHVPLVFFGGHIVPGQRAERVSPQLAAVMLAAGIGEKMKQSMVELPAGIFK